MLCLAFIQTKSKLDLGGKMIVEIKDVSFSYEENRTLLKDITFSVERGQIVSILGPNGVGKTTLLNCIANLITPNVGKVLLEGKDIKKMSPKEIAMKIAFIPQLIIPSFSYEVLSYVVTGCAPRIGIFEKPKKSHYEAAYNCLEQMGIAHLSHKYYAQISGGERQLVSVARALAQRPGIILMDEPTAHLDYGNQIKVLKIIKNLSEEGYTIIITTHNPDYALLLGGKVAALSNMGQFTYGNSAKVITEEFLSFLYGTDLRLCHISDIGRDVCISPSI